MGNQQSIANVNQTQLHYEVTGTGDPVVLIHGLGSDLRVWDAQFPVIAQRYRVLRYDTRGHGKSALPGSEPYAYADDLKALLDYCGMSRAHVVGQSVGGEIAIDYALAYPERVQSLVLVDSTVGGFQWSDDWNASWMPVFAAAGLWSGAWQAATRPGAAPRRRAAGAGWHCLRLRFRHPDRAGPGRR